MQRKTEPVNISVKKSKMPRQVSLSQTKQSVTFTSTSTLTIIKAKPKAHYKRVANPATNPPTTTQSP
jgi:hypothetical protein